jgi:hypothetical protein
MVITDDRVGPMDAKVEGNQIQCCNRGEGSNDRIVRALQWLGRHFTLTGNPGSPRRLWHYYYLYGLERV